jgi:hypothetical protein
MVGSLIPLLARANYHGIGKSALQTQVMTETCVARIMTHVTNLAPGWGETGLLIWSIRRSLPSRLASTAASQSVSLCDTQLHSKVDSSSAASYSAFVLLDETSCFDHRNADARAWTRSAAACINSHLLVMRGLHCGQATGALSTPNPHELLSIYARTAPRRLLRNGPAGQRHCRREAVWSITCELTQPPVLHGETTNIGTRGPGPKHRFLVLLLVLCSVASPQYFLTRENLVQVLLQSAANGALVNLTQLHPFIITLGTAAIYRGVTLIISDSRSVFGFDRSFVDVVAGRVFGVPVPIIIAAAAAGFLFFVARYTKLGRNEFLRRTRAGGRCRDRRPDHWRNQQHSEYHERGVVLSADCDGRSDYCCSDG